MDKFRLGDIIIWPEDTRPFETMAIYLGEISVSDGRKLYKIRNLWSINGCGNIKIHSIEAYQFERARKATNDEIEAVHLHGDEIFSYTGDPQDYVNSYITTYELKRDANGTDDAVNTTHGTDDAQNHEDLLKETEVEKINPNHYQAGDIQVIDIIRTFKLSFSKGNAVKYILRAGKKADEEMDLRKAIWYIMEELGLEPHKNQQMAEIFLDNERLKNLGDCLDQLIDPEILQVTKRKIAENLKHEFKIK